MTMIRSVWEEIWQGHISRVSDSCETKFDMRSLNSKRTRKNTADIEKKEKGRREIKNMKTKSVL